MDARQKSFYLAQRRRYERYVWALGPTFWLPMREPTGSIAGNHMYRDDDGPELFTNPGVVDGVGSPYTFTSDVPDSWTTYLTGSGDITEVASGEGHVDAPTPGGGHINLYAPGADAAHHYQSVLSLGDTFRSVVDIDKITSGGVYRRNAGFALIGSPILNAGVDTLDFIAIYADTRLGLAQIDGDEDVTIAGHSVRKIGEVDAQIVGTTSLGQAGQMGVKEAFLLDGATSLLTIINRASIQGLDEFSLWMLFKPMNAGESNAGTLFFKSGEFELRFNSASRDLYATVHYDTTDAEATTTTTLAANTWHSVGLRIDSSGKQIDLFVDGVEASYASRISGVGSRTSNTNNLIIGNNAAVTQTLAGLVDEAMLLGRALTDGEWLLLHRMAGLDD